MSNIVRDSTMAGFVDKEEKHDLVKYFRLGSCATLIGLVLRAIFWKSYPVWRRHMTTTGARSKVVPALLVPENPS